VLKISTFDDEFHTLNSVKIYQGPDLTADYWYLSFEFDLSSSLFAYALYKTTKFYFEPEEVKDVPPEEGLGGFSTVRTLIERGKNFFVW